MAKRNGEGWFIMTAEDGAGFSFSEDGAGFGFSGGPYETLQQAEKELKTLANGYDGLEVMLCKVQRRMKVEVQTVKQVTFK